MMRVRCRATPRSWLVFGAGFVAVCVLTAAILPVLAQEGLATTSPKGRVTGKVIDGTSGAPVAGAVVTLRRAGGATQQLPN
jgi:hypothetical protein